MGRKLDEELHGDSAVGNAPRSGPEFIIDKNGMPRLRGRIVKTREGGEPDLPVDDRTRCQKNSPFDLSCTVKRSKEERNREDGSSQRPRL